MAPGILEWLGHLSNERAIARNLPVRVRAIGMVYGSNSSVIDDIVNDILALRALLAQRDAQGLARIATSCVEAADAAVRAVGVLAGDLAIAAGGEGSGPRSRTTERVYAQLDQPFRDWLLALEPGHDTAAAQTVWHERAAEIVRGEARDLLRNLPSACWEGRLVHDQPFTAAHAEARFWKSLREALTYAFPAADHAA